MPLVGLLHRRIMRGTTQTEVYLAASGDRGDLGDLTLFHKHHYNFAHAASTQVQGFRIGEGDATLLQGEEVVYGAAHPFVLAEVSDTELGYVFDPNRHDDKSFVDSLLAPYLAIDFLREAISRAPIFDDKQKARAMRQIYEEGAFRGKSLAEYAASEDLQEGLQESLSRLKQTLKEKLEAQGAGDQYEFFKRQGFETMKELQIIELLLDVKGKGVSHLAGLNEDDRPRDILHLVDMKY
jgi:hypothetical protein